MLQFATDLVDLSTKLQTFIMRHAASLPEFTRNKLLEAGLHPSPVDRIVNAAEALYAVKSDLSAEGRVMCAQLAQFAAVNGWHGMGERGLKIAQAMQRIGGYNAPAGSAWPKAEDDPEPIAQMVEPPAEPEPVDSGIAVPTGPE